MAPTAGMPLVSHREPEQGVCSPTCTRLHVQPPLHRGAAQSTRGPNRLAGKHTGAIDATSILQPRQVNGLSLTLLR